MISLYFCHRVIFKTQNHPWFWIWIVLKKNACQINAWMLGSLCAVSKKAFVGNSFKILLDLGITDQWIKDLQSCLWNFHPFNWLFLQFSFRIQLNLQMRKDMWYLTGAMFTLYRFKGFWSLSKVVLVQCEQKLMFCTCYGAEIVPKCSQCEQKSYPSYILQHSLFYLKRSFTKTWFRPFQKPVRYGTFHFQQRSGAAALLFRRRKCFKSSVPSVNRSPIC